MTVPENNRKHRNRKLFLKFLHFYLENHDGSLRKYALDIPDLVPLTKVFYFRRHCQGHKREVYVCNTFKTVHDRIKLVLFTSRF